MADVEQHENQFTGWWIPAEVVAMFQDGTINARTMILLAVIDGLSKRGGDPLGCWASNEYLAKQIGGCDPRSVRGMVQQLKELKLVRQSSFDGRRRYLVTVWTDALANASKAKNNRPGRKKISSPPG